MFIAIVFLIVKKKQIQPKGPPADRWMNTENIMLNQRSQTQKTTL